MNPPFLVLSGNIGAGKSTLSEVLTQKLNISLFEEEFAQNPHLEAAYEDPVTHRAACDEWFLRSTARAHEVAQVSGGIQDRGLREMWEAFVLRHHDLGWYSPAQFAHLQELYHTLTRSLREPDLVVYLRTTPDLSLQRIHARGREMEEGLSEEFLASLHSRLEKMNATWSADVIVVDPFPLEEIHTVTDRIAQRVLAWS